MLFAFLHSAEICELSTNDLTNLEELTAKIDKLLFKYELAIQQANKTCQVYKADEALNSNEWLLISQRIGRNHFEFDKSWNEFKNGFGSTTSNYWIGLEKLHQLTRIPKKIRIEFVDNKDATADFEYTKFQVGNENSGYRLNLGLQVKIFI